MSQINLSVDSNKVMDPGILNFKDFGGGMSSTECYPIYTGLWVLFIMFYPCSCQINVLEYRVLYQIWSWLTTFNIWRLIPIQGSWQRLWCVPFGTGHYPCWQSEGGEGPLVAQDPSNMAMSQLSEWHTWTVPTHHPKAVNLAVNTQWTFQKRGRITLTSSGTCWRFCGMQILPFLHGCFPAVPDIQLDVWLWNGSVFLRRSFSLICHERFHSENIIPALLPVFWPLCLIRFDTADIVRSAFHQCVHQIISLSLSETEVRHQCFVTTHKTEETLVDTHLDLGAGCGRPAFLIRVQVFREQTMDEDTVQTDSQDLVCFISFIVYLQNIQRAKTWNEVRGRTIHCFAWAQWGLGKARPCFSHRSRWYHTTPEATQEKFKLCELQYQCNCLVENIISLLALYRHQDCCIFKPQDARFHSFFVLTLPA